MSARSSWLHAGLTIENSRRHGKGVFSTASIRAGERIAIFGGDVMYIDEIATLPDAMQTYPMQIEERFVLGKRCATEPDEADFFNHSCNPNAGFRGQMFLVALRPLVAGEEVTFDYAMVVSESIGSSITFQMDCRCGEELCRHVITESDWQLPELQRRYAGYFSQYLQERIDAVTSSETNGSLTK